MTGADKELRGMRRTTVIAACLLALFAAARADWTSIGPEGGPMYSGAVTATAPPTIYAAANGYGKPLFCTRDGGATWNAPGTIPYGPYAMAAHPTDTNRLYGVYSSLFLRTTDAGATWTQTSLGSNTVGYDLALNPLNPQVIYCAGYWYDGAAWRLAAVKSTNGGQNWAVTALDTASSAYGYSCAVDPVDTNVVYVGGYAGTTTAFYRSTDCGASWTKVAWPENAYYVYSIAVSPVDHDIVFAGTLYGIFRSTDQGQTWSKRSTGYYNYRIIFAPDSQSVMYSAAYSGVYRSTDSGMNWTLFTAGIEGSNVRFVLAPPGDPGAVYCGSTAGMYRSADYGQNWSAANTGILVGSIPVVSFDPSQTGTVYAEFVDNAVFKTTDLGASWQRQPTVLSCGNVCNIIIEPQNPQRRWMFEASG
jgi:photosystem II stability/assembly factor-like uncharacterized protein